MQNFERYNMIKVGSEWIGSNFKSFIVRGIEQRNDGMWISYASHAEDRTYECLIGAFLQRFKLHTN